MENFLIRSWWQRSIVKKKVAPEGFFPVYVGPDKQWFAIKTKYANHPLFQMLLEDAQVEYGYNTPGPILLPCEVDLFYRVVGEIEAREMEPHGSCGFGYGLFSWFDQMGKGYGSYGVLTPSRLVKIN